MKELKRQKQKYFDEISNDGSSFYSRYSEKYLRDKYDITPEEYYNIVVFNDKHHKCYCEYCHNELKFKSLYLGYGRFCSQSCITKDRLRKESEKGINPFQNPEFIDENRKRVSEYQKSRIRDGSHKFLNYTREEKCKIERERFLSYNYSSARLYICSLKGLDGKYKIGITGIDSYNSRQNYKGHYTTDMHYLVKGTPEDISLLELNIKLNYCKDSEIIDQSQLSNVLEYINNMCTSSTTIERLNNQVE